MTYQTTPAYLVILVVMLVICAAWIAWGVREYRRTGRTQWLWMAGIMLLGLVGLLGARR